MNSVQCDRCGTWFDCDTTGFGILKKGGLKVQYFSCPECGEKFHVFTEDAEMHKLIERRNAVQTQIRIARAKKFRKQTIQKYTQELEAVIQKQRSLMPKLKAEGEKILRDLKCEVKSK